MFPVCGNPLFELFLNFFEFFLAWPQRPETALAADRRRSGNRRGSSGPGPSPKPGAGRGRRRSPVRAAAKTPTCDRLKGNARGDRDGYAERASAEAPAGRCAGRPADGVVAPRRGAARPVPGSARRRAAAPGPDGYPQFVNRSAHSRIAGVAGRRRAASAEARRSSRRWSSGSAAHRLRRRPAFASHVDFLRLGLRSAGFAGRPASAVKVENAGNSAFDGVIVFNFLMQIINNLNAKARFHGPGRQGWNSGGRRFSRRGEPSRGDQEVASEQQKPLFFKGLRNLKRFGERRRAHRGYAAIPLAAW